MLKTSKHHKLVNDNWISKKQQQNFIKQDAIRFSGLALLGKNGKVLMKVDLLHPKAELDDFNIENEGRHTQWESSSLEEGERLIGVCGDINDFEWFDLLSFNVSDNGRQG